MALKVKSSTLNWNGQPMQLVEQRDNVSFIRERLGQLWRFWGRSYCVPKTVEPQISTRAQHDISTWNAVPSETCDFCTFDCRLWCPLSDSLVYYSALLWMNATGLKIYFPILNVFVICWLLRFLIIKYSTQIYVLGSSALLFSGTEFLLLIMLVAQSAIRLDWIWHFCLSGPSKDLG